jgi:cobalt/nickel transport system ATP-binding protein
MIAQPDTLHTRCAPDSVAESTGCSALKPGLCGVDARFKLGVLVTVVGLNVGFARLELSLTLFGIGLVAALWSRVPPRRFLLFFLAPAWATLLVFIGFSIGFGRTPAAELGSFTVYTEGIRMGASAAARVACDMTWLAAVFLTTSFDEWVSALRWYRVPGVLVDTTAMAYRYAFQLYSEFGRMREAAQSRGGLHNFQESLRATAMILSQILLRAYDRSHRIQLSMMARGEFGAPAADEPISGSSEPCPNRCDITPRLEDESRPLLVCRDLSYSHGNARSLEGISLTVRPGEVVALCGPNGAGKTTLLRLVAGLLIPDRGDIAIDGVALDRNTRREAFRHTGLMMQDPSDQLFCTHVRDDVAYGPRHLGLEAAEIDRRVGVAMELMNVHPLTDRPIHSLSHGEMKRVALAGIIAMQPPLILLDEPTASLDPASARQLVELLEHLNRHHGYTLLVVTHDVQLAARIAHRIVILDRGRLVVDGPAARILQDRNLLENSRLEPPILTALFEKLQSEAGMDLDIPVTVEEAVGLLRTLLREVPRRQPHTQREPETAGAFPAACGGESSIPKDS